LAISGLFWWSAVVTSIFLATALSPYLALKSAIAIRTASTLPLPDRSEYTPDWSLRTAISTLPSLILPPPPPGPPLHPAASSAAPAASATVRP
jgi:hypothetical protein